MKIQSSTKKGRVKRVIARTAIMLGICLAAIIVFIYSAMLVICYGPSPRARDLFVNTCMETSFLKYFPPLVLSSSQIEAIQKANSIVDNGEVTVGQQDYTNVENQNTSQPAIEIVDVVGATYKGKMMIVKDPSRVVVGTSSDTFSADKGGKNVFKPEAGRKRQSRSPLFVGVVVFECLQYIFKFCLIGRHSHSYLVEPILPVNINMVIDVTSRQQI